MLRDITYRRNGTEPGAVERHKFAVAQALSGADTICWAGRPASGPNVPYVLVRAIDAWCQYAQAYAERWDRARIGCDGFLGPAWEAWGRSLHTMLNGETGDLDCATLSAIVLHNLAEQWFDE